MEKLCTDKKAKQRERTKKCRVNRQFKDQIDKDIHDVEREIWMGPRPKLLRSVGVILSGDIGNINITATIRRRYHRIIKVKQRSEMKEIVGYGTNGKGSPRFRGAVVGHEESDGIRYCGVQEGLFMVKNAPCFAKQGLKETANWMLAHRRTGVVNGYVLVLLYSKPNEWQWIPEGGTLEYMSVGQTKRSTAEPDRFKPGTSDETGNPACARPTLPKGARNYYEYYQSDVFRGGGYYTVGMMAVKGDQHWMEKQQEKDERERDFETKVHMLKMMMQANVWDRTIAASNGIAISSTYLYDYLKESMTLPENIRHNIGLVHLHPPCHGGDEDMQMFKEEEKTLISAALKAYSANSNTPDPNRPFPTRKPPQIPNLSLSLTLDVIRGKITGSLGKKWISNWVFFKTSILPSIWT